jgi:hypothetical protein
MRLLLIVLLLVTPALVHAAPPAFVGAWKLSAVRTKAGPVPKDKLDQGGMVWKFKADGTLDMTVTAEGKTATANATWTVKGATLTIDEHGQKNVVTWKRKGAKLEIAGTGNSTVVMTFVKTK